VVDIAVIGDLGYPNTGFLAVIIIIRTLVVGDRMYGDIQSGRYFFGDRMCGDSITILSLVVLYIHR